MRIVKSTPHNHLRTSSYITERDANQAVQIASQRLGKGGVFGVVGFNPSSTEVDPRWDLFVQNLRYEKISTINGIYLSEKDLLAIREQEVPTAEGYHVLLIGTTPDQNIKNGSSLDEVLDLGEKFGALVVADHPFGRRGIGEFLQDSPEYYKKFHGYEVFNGIIRESQNRSAQEEYDAVRIGYPQLSEFVSDDGHSTYELGRSYSNIRMPNHYEPFRNDPEKVNETLKNGYQANRDENLGHQRTPCRRGYLDHAADLILLIAARKLFGWDGNRKTAPFFDRFGIRI